MPVYDFKNCQTGEEWEQAMSYDDMKALTADGNIVIVYKSMNIVSGTGTTIKSDDGFKEVMSRVADANPYSPLAHDYGSKDSLTVKKRNLVDKVRKKVGGAVG